VNSPRSDRRGHAIVFYHLGDIVYYDGESANYWPDFYEPILAAPTHEKEQVPFIVAGAGGYDKQLSKAFHNAQQNN